MPADDDGTRDDPLLSERSIAVTGYRPDADALAQVLETEAVVFPSHHGGFAAEDSGYPGQPEAFARRLREVLDEVP